MAAQGFRQSALRTLQIAAGMRQSAPGLLRITAGLRQSALRLLRITADRAAGLSQAVLLMHYCIEGRRKSVSGVIEGAASESEDRKGGDSRI